ncbi:hypothetical protein EV426DRAFT_699770 [Tirmania nivea]|nr:hypothetical protein EV426DRAFT_699770 [Tirmania nivea]
MLLVKHLQQLEFLSSERTQIGLLDDILIDLEDDLEDDPEDDPEDDSEDDQEQILIPPLLLGQLLANTAGTGIK